MAIPIDSGMSSRARYMSAAPTMSVANAPAEAGIGATADTVRLTLRNPVSAIAIPKTRLSQPDHAAKSEGQLGIQYLGNSQAIQASATHRVQRGTNRPSGKRYRNRLKEAEPRKWSPATVGCHAGCATTSASMVKGWVAVPKVSSARATNSARRSADLSQKISAATAPYTTAKTTSSATP